MKCEECNNETPIEEMLIVFVEKGIFREKKTICEKCFKKDDSMLEILYFHDFFSDTEIINYFEKLLGELP